MSVFDDLAIVNNQIALARTIPQIEAFMARAQKEVRIGLYIPRRREAAGE